MDKLPTAPPSWDVFQERHTKLEQLPLDHAIRMAVGSAGTSIDRLPVNAAMRYVLRRNGVAMVSDLNGRTIGDLAGSLGFGVTAILELMRALDELALAAPVEARALDGGDPVDRGGQRVIDVPAEYHDRSLDRLPVPARVPHALAARGVQRMGDLLGQTEDAVFDMLADDAAGAAALLHALGRVAGQRLDGGTPGRLDDELRALGAFLPPRPLRLLLEQWCADPVAAMSEDALAGAHGITPRRIRPLLQASEGRLRRVRPWLPAAWRIVDLVHDAGIIRPDELASAAIARAWLERREALFALPRLHQLGLAPEVYYDGRLGAFSSAELR